MVFHKICAFLRSRKLCVSKMEGSHNGIAAVLKTAGSDPVGVRVPRPPPSNGSPYEGKGFFFVAIVPLPKRNCCLCVTTP